MKKVSVFLSFDDDSEISVGQLAEQDNKIYFEYDNAFLSKDLWISPYKLPLISGLIEHKERDFGPLFGLFDDSLPDGWGLMLMDRYLRGKGHPVENLSVLDRLSFLGSNTMGALCYKPVLEEERNGNMEFNLHNLYSQSREIIKGESQTVLRELMQAGGSPGGARPKVLVGVSGDKLISGEGDLPEDFDHWIVKFAGINDFEDSGAVEYAYSLMAKSSGIPMTETRIFSTEEGSCFFGIKRFDREGNNRLHSHSLGNLIHSDFRVPSCDYDMLFRVTSDLTKNRQDLLCAFRLMVFNIFMHNRDDHVKNFSFLMNGKGEWSLAPAYDLTFSYGPGGEHSMTVDGEGRSPSVQNIHSLGKKAGIDKRSIDQIIEEILEVLFRWPEYAEMASVSPFRMEKIQKVINNTV